MALSSLNAAVKVRASGEREERGPRARYDAEGRCRVINQVVLSGRRALIMPKRATRASVFARQIYRGAETHASYQSRALGASATIAQ